MLLSESTSLVEFAMQQAPDCVQIPVTPHSNVSVASNEAERSMGAFLDKIVPQAAGALTNTHVTGVEMIQVGEQDLRQKCVSRQW